MAALGGSRDDGAASPSFVAISGEPGIGKSSLLAELTRRAGESGALVLEGRAAEFASAEPFAILVDAFDDYFAAQNPALHASLPAGVLSELALMLPSVPAPSEGEIAAAGADARHRSHRAIAALLVRLRGTKGVVLALDDVHWADEATVELLGQLAATVREPGILIALAFRRGQEDPRIRRAIASADSLGQAVTIEPSPLDRAQAAGLVGEPLESAQLTRLLEESGGNPFYLDCLSRDGLGPSPAPRASEEREAIPVGITAAIEAEMQAIRGAARSMVEAASVAGERFDIDIVTETAQLEADEALAGLDELVQSDLLRPTEVPREFRFRHPIVRRAVYDSMLPGARLGAHSRAALALADRGASPGVRARHVEASAGPGDIEAADLLLAAAADADPRAPAAAAHWYRAALRVLPDEEREKRLPALVGLARALDAIGDFAEAERVLERLLETVPPDEHEARVRIVSTLAKLAHRRSAHDRARELLRAEHERLPDDAGQAMAALKLELGMDAFFAGNYDAMAEPVEEAVRLSEVAGDKALLAAAIGLRGASEYLVGRTAEARADLADAALRFQALDDVALASQAFPLTWVASAAIFTDQFETAIEMIERGIQAAVATGQGFVPTNLRSIEAIALIDLGRLVEAEERLDNALEAWELTTITQAHATSLWVRGWAALIAGDVQGAQAYCERGVEITDGRIDPASVMLHLHLAEIRLEADEPALARDDLLAAAGGEGLPILERGRRARWYELLTRAELKLRDLRAARRWSELAEEAAGGLGIETSTAQAARAEARVLGAEDEPAAAAQSALKAVEAAERVGAPIEASRARILLGRFLAESGDEEAGVQELERAHRDLAAIGARRYADDAASALRALGKRVARVGVASSGEVGVGAMSTREREVADLVADGRANKEIAAELFLSERTVETHLTRIYGKLDLANRTQLAALVNERP